MSKKECKYKSLYDRESLRENTDNITDEIDRQMIENFKTLKKKQNYEEELLSSLHHLKSHDIYPNGYQNNSQPVNTPNHNNEHVQQPTNTVHGEDCHCSKCCPNPRPNFLQRHSFAIGMIILWVALVILAIGWSPAGKTFEAIQTSYVELIVNFFKMSVFAIAGFASYYLIKKRDE